LGHGERRQHGFRTERDHDRPFRVGRQDYFFRYNLGIQLHLIGESLIGWMARDLVRGVDLLLARPGVDPERIVLVGAVAGGGDAAAVAAALDDRIGVVVPFGFGPARDLVGGGSWESTRNLRLSARDGFAPWVLLGSVAPRRLVYAHEFDWDAERDPVWPRLRSVFSWYDRPRHLASVHGRGGVRGPAPENTHCTNVGRVHRRLLDAHLERWLEIHAPSERNHEPLDDAALQCFTPLVPAELAPRPLHELVRELGAERLDAARGVRSGLDPRDRARRLRSELAELLGPIERGEPRVHILADPDRIDLEVTEDVRVRLRLSLPPGAGPWPVVIGLARQGMRRLCGARGELIDALVGGGAAVCLADVRGACDERGGDEQRGRLSLATRVSSDLLMLGRTSLGAALGDLRAVIAYLAQRPDLDAGRLVLWGDSLAPVNPRGCDLEVPYEAEPFPHLCEPLGGLLALVGGLFEERVDAVYLRGALVGYSDVLCGPFLYVPHDVVVPGLLGVADLCDVAAALAPRPLWLEGLVDGLNRMVDAQRLSDAYAPALRGYREAGTPGRLRLEGEPRPAAETAQWMLDALN
jgi:dienelactone hydrolase